MSFSPLGPAGAEPVWVIGDARVLATIRVTGTFERPASLLDLIAACDAMQHLILGADEIEHAVRYLVGADLIAVGGDGFAATPAGRRLVARARGRPGGDPAARMESLLRLLEPIAVVPIDWTLDRRAYRAVTLDYQHSVWETFRAPARRRPPGPPGLT